MTFPKTTVRCPDKRFRTARYARNWAWRIEPDPKRRQVPVECQRCGAWHLADPQATRADAEQRDGAPTANDTRS